LPSALIDEDESQVFLRLSRKDLLDTAECRGFVTSSSREKRSQIFTMRDGHAHYHLGLRRKTYRVLKEMGTAEIHSPQVALWALKETYQVLRDIQGRLEAIPTADQYSVRILHQTLGEALE